MRWLSHSYKKLSGLVSCIIEKQGTDLFPICGWYLDPGQRDSLRIRELYAGEYIQVCTEDIQNKGMKEPVGRTSTMSA